MAGKLEVEAKFKVTDREVFSHLLAQERLGRFELKLAPTYHVEDVYQDTADNHLARAGYACRVRRRGGTWLVSLKEQVESRDMVHERTEFESPLPYFELDPLRWPESEARQLAIQLSGGAAFRRLFTIHQVRHTRIVADGDRQLAEFSLDEVRLDVPGHHLTYFELEVEQLPECAVEEFDELSKVIREEWSLEAQTESKFLVAMSLLAAPGEGEPLPQSSSARLWPADRPLLRYIAENARPPYARRARLLLDWDAGAGIRVLQDMSGYSRSSVYHWLHAYHEDRLNLFPKQLLGEAARALSAECPPRYPGYEWESALLSRKLAESEPGSCPAPAEREHPERYLAGEPSAPPPESPMMRSVEDLYRCYDVDLAHARHVASLALRLFDASQEYHGLPASSRRLLELGAMLHNLGMNLDPERHHIAGRDVLLESPVRELSEDERLMVAAMAFLHRKQMTRKKLKKKTVLNVPQKRRRETLNLAALIRIADGLDYSQSQMTHIIETNATPAVIEVVLQGPYAVHDAVRAEDKADLWNLLHPVRFYFRVMDSSSPSHNPGPGELTAPDRGNTDDNREAPGGATVLEASPAPLQLVSEMPATPWQGSELEAPTATANREHGPPAELALLAEWVQEEPGILPDDPMSEAGRKLFRFHLHKMLLHEAGTVKGEDIEELHDMRVAIRRLRSAWRLVVEFFSPKVSGALIKGLQRTGRILGAVRDLDVLLEKASQYQQTLPTEEQDGLEPLVASWRAQREAARSEMIAYLNGRDYRQFVQRFTAFVTSEGAGAKTVDAYHPCPHRVRHVVPAVIYSHLAAVRAYEDGLVNPPLEYLHALRIECKRLRYALEFFREVLGPEARMVIKEVTALQDHLGELHDADVADHLLRDFLDGGAGSPQHIVGDKKPAAWTRQRVMAPGVALYLAERQRELQRLVQSFPETWAHFNRPEVRQNLAAAVAVL